MIVRWKTDVNLFFKFKAYLERIRIRIQQKWDEIHNTDVNMDKDR